MITKTKHKVICSRCEEEISVYIKSGKKDITIFQLLVVRILFLSCFVIFMLYVIGS